jgi:branched-subunit amino acid ABC-type transport system permease component
MIAFVMSQALTMPFASGWHVENRVLWIVLGVVFVLLLMAVYLLIRTRWGHAERPRSRDGASGPQ